MVMCHCCPSSLAGLTHVRSDSAMYSMTLLLLMYMLTHINSKWYPSQASGTQGTQVTRFSPLPLSLSFEVLPNQASTELPGVARNLLQVLQNSHHHHSPRARSALHQHPTCDGSCCPASALLKLTFISYCTHGMVPGGRPHACTAMKLHSLTERYPVLQHDVVEERQQRTVVAHPEGVLMREFSCTSSCTWIFTSSMRATSRGPAAERLHRLLAMCSGGDG